MCARARAVPWCAVPCASRPSHGTLARARPCERVRSTWPALGEGEPSRGVTLGWEPVALPRSAVRPIGAWVCDPKVGRSASVLLSGRIGRSSAVTEIVTNLKQDRPKQTRRTGKATTLPFVSIFYPPSNRKARSWGTIRASGTYAPKIGARAIRRAGRVQALPRCAARRSVMVQPDHLIPARQGGSRRCIVWSSLGGEEQSRRGSDTLTGAEEVPGLWVEKPQTRIMRARLERRETSSRLEAWLMSEP